MKYIDNTDSAAAIEAVRLGIAQEQAARHQAATAITNWSSGYTYAEVQLARALPPSTQSRWHDVAQDHFLAWLTAGGFSQAEPEDMCAPASATPQGQTIALPRSGAGGDARARPADASLCVAAEPAQMEWCGKRP